MSVITVLLTASVAAASSQEIDRKCELESGSVIYSHQKIAEDLSDSDVNFIEDRYDLDCDEGITLDAYTDKEKSSTVTITCYKDSLGGITLNIPARCYTDY